MAKFSDDGVCCVPTCTRDESSDWLCDAHYFIWNKQGGPISKPYGDLCGIEGCTKKAKKKGMCGVHGTRYSNSGNPYLGPSDEDLKIIFLQNVKQQENGEPCLLYYPMESDEYKGTKSYDYFHWDGRQIPIRHLSYWVETGEWLPEGTVSLAVCGRSTCVNIAHMYVGPKKQNIGVVSETAKLVGQTRRMLRGFQPMYDRFGNPVYKSRMWRKSGICIEEGCVKDEKLQDRCQLHYKRWWNKYRDTPPCKIDGCEVRQYSLGMCKTHYEKYSSSRRQLTNIKNAITLVVDKKNRGKD